MGKKNFLKKFFLTSFLALAFSMFLFSDVHAATLYITPTSAKISKGSTFTVTVKTDTKGSSVNVAEATVVFPSDILQIISVSPGATFSLQTPGSPSKTQSQAFFSAGLPSPGFNGSAGVLGKITFRAISTGKATISISSGKVLLNDGNATDALSGTSDGVIDVVPPSSTGILDNTIVPVPVTSPAPKTPTPVKEIPLNPTTPTTKDVNLVPTEQLPLQPSTPVFSIVVTVKDLINIIYIALTFIIILLLVIIFLLINNSRERRNLPKYTIRRPRGVSSNPKQ